MKHRSVLLTFIAVVAVAVALLSGCSGSGVPQGSSVTGVITEVSGDITVVTAFVVLDGDGSSHRFSPAPGLLFDGGPLTHLREHVVTGHPVVVTFERGTDGELIAVAVEDV